MQLLGHLRRAHRTLLKKERCLAGMSKQEVVDNIPNNCDEEQWKKLVEYWFTEGVKTKALQNKASRGFQKEIPRTGPRSLAQLVAILFIYYRHKDGTPVTDKAAENMRRMQELLNAGTQLIGESSHGGGILWAPDDAYAQVMGKERHGRVRGVGFGPTPSGRKAKDVLPDSTTPRQSYASDQRVVELEDQIATLTRARAEDANKIEALVQLVTLERTQRIERDAQFKKMMDSVSQHVRELRSQSEKDAHADVDDGDELDDGDALDDDDAHADVDDGDAFGDTLDDQDAFDDGDAFNDVHPGLAERFVSVCWGIWKERNVVRTGGRGKPGRVTLKTSLGLMDEFQMANEGPWKPAIASPDPIRWVPPPPGQYKVNSDGAVFANQRKVGLGMVIRDSNGNVIAALSSPMVGPLGALEKEAKALEAGMRFALDIGIRDAVLECDALEVFNAVQGFAAPSSSILFIMDGILQQARWFKSCCFFHTKRQGNVPAHMLAQYAKSLVSYVAWVESCPSHVERACAQDIDVATIP
ncbi:hypothetical protein SO802_025335 [Lithocarpus litseifolius]|uniref:RNase H type-1 domain-containing protein n=1 Tax=Lithocarpus litseifolius TaxID=425828 RepID=A0AAW2BWD5_9ROSI